MGPRARKGNRRERRNDRRRRRTTLVAHVPTLGRPENTPEYQQTLVQAERKLGAAMREALKPDLWVIVSTHWVSTFDWFSTCQPKHEGLCVAQEAPNLIPGLPYKYRGDPEFGAALVDAWKEAGVAAVRNEAANYNWDYGTYVPLKYLDPKARCRGRHPGGANGRSRRMPACRRGGACGSEEAGPPRRLPLQQRALASARARPAQLADARARRGGQALRRATEARRDRRGDRRLH